MLFKASTLSALSLSLPLLALSDYASATASSTSDSISLRSPYLGARSPSSGHVYTRPKPNLARWAEYSKASNGAAARKARRAEGAVGVPAAAKFSPLPPLSGETITKTVAQQIKVG